MYKVHIYTKMVDDYYCFEDERDARLFAFAYAEAIDHNVRLLIKPTDIMTCPLEDLHWVDNGDYIVWIEQEI